MRMRVCNACGTPVADTWEECLRCGAELTPLAPPPPTLLDRASHRVRTLTRRPSPPTDAEVAKTSSATTASIRPRRAGVAGGTSGASNAGGPSRISSRLDVLGNRVPAWTFAPLVLAIVALLVIIATTGGEDDTVLAERDAAAAQVTTLTQSLADVEAERDRLAAEVAAAEERASTLESSVESGSADLDELRSDLTAAENAAIEAQDALVTATATLEEQQARLAAFEECLDGMVVAIAFAREGRNGAADVAMDSVAGACAAAGG